MTEIIGSMLAGLGLIFLSLKILNENLSELADGPMRDVIKKHIATPIQSGICGILLGLVSGEPTLVGIIASSLYACKSTTFKNAIVMSVWCNVGVCCVYFLLFFDINIFVFYLIGLLGFFYSQERPFNFRHIIGVIFSICILLYGLNLMGSHSEKLTQIPWISENLHNFQTSYLLPYITAALITVLLQGEDLILLIIIISLFGGNILTANQAIFMVSGMHLGLAFFTFIFVLMTKGVARQIFAVQMFMDIIIALAIPLVVIVELVTGIPLLIALTTTLFDTIWAQLIFIIVLANVTLSLLFSIFVDPISMAVKNLLPAAEVIDPAKPKYLGEINVHDPESALDLIDREIYALIVRIPPKIEQRISSQNPEQFKIDLKLSHEQYVSVITAIEKILGELSAKSLDPVTGNRLLMISERLQIAISFEGGVYHLLKISLPTTAPESIQKLAIQIYEVQQVQIETALAAVKDNAQDDITNLIIAMKNAKTAIENVRQAYLKEDSCSSVEIKSIILNMTSIFERNIWLMQRFINQYASEIRHEAHLNL